MAFDSVQIEPFNMVNPTCDDQPEPTRLGRQNTGYYKNPWTDNPYSIRLVDFMKQIYEEQSNSLLVKIGECVTFVNGPSVNDCFKYAVLQTHLKDVEDMPKEPTDNKIKMLEAALKYRPAFVVLKGLNHDFRMRMNLTDRDYSEAEKILDVLKSVEDAYSKGRFLTPNVYLQIICEIYKKLPLELLNLVDLDSVKKLRDSFWKTYEIVLAIAVFLDPRFDYDSLEQWFEEMFGGNVGETQLEQFYDNFFQFYRAYGGSGDIDSSTSEHGEYMRSRDSIQTPDLDILTWWSIKARRFPTFARMARDIFNIPFYTTILHRDSELQREITSAIVATDTNIEILEAYICLKNWLKT
ncbi:hypothetical protein ACOSQ2_024141 [Xanthoceras sorbifolium]